MRLLYRYLEKIKNAILMDVPKSSRKNFLYYSSATLEKMKFLLFMSDLSVKTCFYQVAFEVYFIHSIYHTLRRDSQSEHCRYFLLKLNKCYLVKKIDQK